MHVFNFLFYFVVFVSPAGTPKSQLPINLLSTTNQQKVSQNLPIKQQIPLKLASRLSSGTLPTTSVPSSAGPQQMLPLKLSQDEKVRRSSTSGYQRLSSDSFSPPSETVRTFSIIQCYLDQRIRTKKK